MKLHHFFRTQYISLVTLVTTLLTRTVNRLALHLINLKGLDLNPLPPPAPNYADAVRSVARKQLQIPYVPSWVAASFKNPSKHPGFYPTLPKPDPAAEVSTPVVEETLQATQPAVVMETSTENTEIHGTVTEPN